VADADRVRDAYARRDAQGHDARYSLLDPANLYLYQRRERAFVELLHRLHLTDLSQTRVLDVGCGSGDVLRDFVRYGADPANLAGIDLLPERIDRARELCPPAIDLRAGDATALPYRDASFDLVLQFTLMSSVLDAVIRRRIAAELTRVLRPGGAIIWYDFIWNPLNRDSRGIGMREVRRLFPGCAVDGGRATLAPPISRRLARVSWTLCRALEAIPPLRSHYMLAIRRRA
jgi:ubiquinone/menaquinone biosynthesis C-methylase UbiE